MPAPFNYTAVSAKAERLAGKLKKSDSYRDDIWNDPTLGPLVRVYALLTHFPEEAFSEPVTAEFVAECRTYARLLHSEVYDGLVGASTFNDDYFELLSEYDSLVDANLEAAMEAAKSDGQTLLVELKKAGKRSRAAKPGTVRRVSKSGE